jgi:hypothetical protein
MNEIVVQLPLPALVMVNNACGGVGAHDSGGFEFLKV